MAEQGRDKGGRWTTPGMNMARPTTGDGMGTKVRGVKPAPGYLGGAMGPEKTTEYPGFEMGKTYDTHAHITGAGGGEPC